MSGKLHLGTGRNVKFEKGIHRARGADRIFSVSFPPIISCSKNLPCQDICYAKSLYKRRTCIRVAWLDNLELYMSRPTEFWRELDERLERLNKPPKFFRFFVSGDFPRKEMVQETVEFAKRHPDTIFMAFTKRWIDGWIPPRKDLPDNLKIRLSAMPQIPTNPRKNLRSYPVAWMTGSGIYQEDRIPQGAIECDGGCVTCTKCWTTDDDVVFHIHGSGRYVRKNKCLVT